MASYGRDPYFPAWPDALQLDYSNPNAQDAMLAAFLTIAGQCDGVRCDMAMLVLPDVLRADVGPPASAVLAAGHRMRTASAYPRSKSEPKGGCYGFFVNPWRNSPRMRTTL